MNPLMTSRLLLSTMQASAQTIAGQLRRGKAQLPKDVYPIVLMHGLAGFRDISIAGIKLFDYFNGVVLMLNQMGYTAFAPQVPFFAKPQDRASAWFHEIEKIRRNTGANKVHLVGHSQGGLDARVLIAPNTPAQDTPLGPLMGLGYGPHVASVVSVGTPHLGSALVDIFNEGDPSNAKLIDAVTDLISVIARVFSGDPQDAKGVIQALGRDYMLDYFNPIIADNPAVPCYTIGGDPETVKLVTPLLLASYLHLLDLPVIEGGGPNDGLVTVQSALFGFPLPGSELDFEFCAKEHPRPHWQPLGIIQADHVEMVGIPAQLIGTDVYDHLAAFTGTAQFLDPNFDMTMTLEKNGHWTRHPKHARGPRPRRKSTPAVTASPAKRSGSKPRTATKKAKAA
jgi:triacylglycerol lipase